MVDRAVSSEAFGTQEGGPPDQQERRGADRQSVIGLRHQDLRLANKSISIGPAHEQRLPLAGEGSAKGRHSAATSALCADTQGGCVKPLAVTTFFPRRGLRRCLFPPVTCAKGKKAAPPPAPRGAGSTTGILHGFLKPKTAVEHARVRGGLTPKVRAAVRLRLRPPVGLPSQSSSRLPFLLNVNRPTQHPLLFQSKHQEMLKLQFRKQSKQGQHHRVWAASHSHRHHESDHKQGPGCLQRRFR